MYPTKPPTPTWQQFFWRDIDSRSYKRELLAKIAVIVGGLILLAGCVAACYYLAVTTRTVNSYLHPGYCNHITGVISSYQVSNAPFMAIPLIFMPTTAMAGFVGSHFINFERHHSRQSEKRDISWYAERLFVLRTKSFPDAHSYVSSHGGIGPLVRSGLLSVELGTTLQELFNDHEKSQDVAERWSKFQEEITPKTEEPW